MNCIYCGNNPVPHSLAWIDNTLTAITNDIASTAIGAYISRLMPSRAADDFAVLMARTLLKVGVLKMSASLSDKKNYRASVLYEEAQQRGIPMYSLLFLSKPTDTYIAKVKGKEIFITGLPRAPKKSNENTFWLDDKAIVKIKLSAAGIPVPRGDSACSWREAKKIFNAIEKPVVVKPRLGSRGRHTTTLVSTIDEFRSAYHIAKQLCFWVVIEEHLVGSVFRATIIDGVVEGILRGDPPRVTGDGAHTIRELVDLKNKYRHEKVKPVTLSAIHDIFLKHSGLTIESILAKGTTIDLIEKIGVSYGGNSAEDTVRTHPEIIRIMTKAGRVLNDPMIGLDFIIDDIEKDPAQQKWGTTECNAVPFINLHHDPVEGKPRNIAAKVWDYVDRHISEF